MVVEGIPMIVIDYRSSYQLLENIFSKIDFLYLITKEIIEMKICVLPQMCTDDALHTLTYQITTTI